MATVVAIVGALLVGVLVLYLAARYPAVRRVEEWVGWLGRWLFRIVVVAVLVLIVGGFVAMVVTS